jgi:hypothetical protein
MGVSFIIKSIINNKVNKDFEFFKIRFSKLHNDRAESIKKLYSKLVKMEESMRSWMDPRQFPEEENKEKKQKIAQKNVNRFIRYYNINRIIFRKDICKIIDEINKKMDDTWLDFASIQAYEKGDNERRKLWKKSWNTIGKEIPKLKHELEDEFREILGVK